MATMLLMMMVGHAAVSAKSSLQLTRIGHANDSTTLLPADDDNDEDRPHRRLGQLSPRLCRIGHAAVSTTPSPVDDDNDDNVVSVNFRRGSAVSATPSFRPNCDSGHAAV
jgi:hypothetical protein